ncbi:unnamed protein product [Rhizophagus irregularis]|uniref:AIG1-type G domain-containing protein n=1 Tax=Rhizophagus irregularis TaxID=588596 RepID=A0A2I1GS23_9GLOM|nr:hypothetical protein RhiirA4_422901 [Rhizophagus irregularis]CAB4444954.1 unnamed protein product [Rhizophagus irregularis]CAB4445072.1 unnamed protein product [Rhizophagus irregularis]
MSRENVLVIGITNSGKSALANVICETEYFEESESTVRNSNEFQQYDFDYDDRKYRVIETRFKLMEKEILYKIGRVIRSMPEGISQVLFVVEQRLTAEEKDKLSEIEEEILKIKICKYTTIVRAKFKDFKSKDKCKKDEEELRSSNKKIFNKKIFNKPRMPTVHVDNPPTHIYVCDDSDDDITIENNNIRRKKSRIILLDHLDKVCSKQSNKYKLNMWDRLYESDKSTDNLEERVKSHLKKYDPKVAEMIKKLTNSSN